MELFKLKTINKLNEWDHFSVFVLYRVPISNLGMYLTVKLIKKYIFLQPVTLTLDISIINLEEIMSLVGSWQIIREVSHNMKLLAYNSIDKNVRIDTQYKFH